MCTFAKQVLHSDAGEDAEAHAAKLLEVVLLQYKSLIDQVPIVALVQVECFAVNCFTL